MNIEQQWQVYDENLQPAIYTQENAQYIAALVDLTLLDEQATASQLQALSQKAFEHQVAAVCVYPQHLPYFISPSPFKRATVVNFPQGNNSVKTVLTTIDSCISNFFAEEIDYVFPYQQYLEGNHNQAIDHYQQIVKHCQQHRVTLKVILETGAFSSAQALYDLSYRLLDNPCDFLKTSTGKIATGATPLAAFCLMKAIAAKQCNTGIKISGGVKTPQQAQFYINMAAELLNKKADSSWFRLGASSLLDSLTAQNNS